MEKENCQANADSTGVCKKVYSAVAANPAFRAIHRKSRRSPSPMAVISTDPNQPGVGRTDNAAKTNVLDPLKKPVEAGPGGVHIPIEFGPSVVPEEKVKTAKPPPSVQSSGRATISPAKIAPPGHSKTKEDTSIPVSHGRLSEVASKKEAKPAVSPLMEEKLKQEKTASPSIIAIQGPGQVIIAPPTVEPARPSPASLPQEEQRKPKAHAAAVTKTLSTKIDHPNLHYQGDQEDKKPEHSTVSDKFSDYLTRVKNKMRTPSNVSEGTVNTSPFTRLATRRDSFNDKVAGYINRARKGIRTTSNVGDA